MAGRTVEIHIVMLTRILILTKKTIISLKINGFNATLQKIKFKCKEIYQGFYRRFNHIRLDTITSKERQSQLQHTFSRNIKISILVPLYNTPDKFLHEMIGSVQNQTYSNWELCMADGSDDKHKSVMEICEKYCNKDKRIKYKKLAKNFGISGNTNECISMATGEYIALFDHDDIMHQSALFHVMKAICEKEADFIYTDEATFSCDLKTLICIHWKPDYAVDNLRANNYICHLSVFSRKLLDEAGCFLQ